MCVCVYVCVCVLCLIYAYAYTYTVHTPHLPYTLWPGVVAPDRALSMG